MMFTYILDTDTIVISYPTTGVWPIYLQGKHNLVYNGSFGYWLESAIIVCPIYFSYSESVRC